MAKKDKKSKKQRKVSQKDAARRRIELVELTARRFGGQVLDSSDDFFAAADNLLNPQPAIFLPDKYTDKGKWMDGWESRRRRGPGHDWCLLQLGLPGAPRLIEIDTSFFDGNHPETASLEGTLLRENESSESAQWFEILPPVKLKGNSKHFFHCGGSACSHLRLHIYPDGGVARLRVYGDVFPGQQALSQESEESVELASLLLGARVLAASDMHFGSYNNLLLPGRAADMREGWETRRRRGPGFDWCIVQLAGQSQLDEIEVDTAHFKGNYPESCSIEGCLGDGLSPTQLTSAEWMPVLDQTRLEPDTRHHFNHQLLSRGPFRYLRLNIFPDGGISRLRVRGRLEPTGWMQLGLNTLNLLPESEAENLLRGCCGATRWVRRMLRQRPFTDVAHIQTEADAIWWELGSADYLEAFGRHPRIGQQTTSAEQSADWSRGEQAGVESACDPVRARLVELNDRYYQKFGYIFIVNATGKSAEEMLHHLEQRFPNDPNVELQIAAEQQRQITQIRLEKMLRK